MVLCWCQDYTIDAVRKKMVGGLVFFATVTFDLSLRRRSPLILVTKRLHCLTLYSDAF